VKHEEHVAALACLKKRIDEKSLTTVLRWQKVGWIPLKSHERQFLTDALMLATDDNGGKDVLFIHKNPDLWWIKQ